MLDFFGVPGLHRWLLAIIALAAVTFGTDPARADTLDDIRERGYLTWGADLEGSAPFVMLDPANPERITGFEADMMVAIAKSLGVTQRLVNNDWGELIPALNRKSFDVVICGVEITPEHSAEVLYSRPYYAYREQIVVRAGTQGVASLDDLKGKRVATLSNTVAERMMDARGDITVARYTSAVYPYDDLLLGRVDAVIQDNPVALAYGQRPGLINTGAPFAMGHYGILMRHGDARLKQAIDRAVDTLYTSGQMEAILRRYHIWNADQVALRQWQPTTGAPKVQKPPFSAQLSHAWPLLLSGTVMTLKVSVLAMMVAIIWGIILASLRVYGPVWLGFLAACYVEYFRGTPLLVQLLLIYYGLPKFGIQLDAFVAAVMGLGLNYAAYEAENYRAGLLAVPKGQTEAALSLGLSRWQTLIHVQLPQSVRIVLPSVTNDFIALFKDSSVVSMIALVELTKVYNMLASASYDFISYGLIISGIYFALSYPTSRFSRWLEVRLKTV